MAVTKEYIKDPLTKGVELFLGELLTNYATGYQVVYLPTGQSKLVVDFVLDLNALIQNGLENG